MRKFVILSLAEASEAIAQYLAAKGDAVTVSSLDVLPEGKGGMAILCGIDGFKPDPELLSDIELIESIPVPTAASEFDEEFERIASN